MEHLKLSDSPEKATVKFSETEEGTPQGGVVSPLLANIALHGLEEEIARGYRQDALNRRSYGMPMISSFFALTKIP